MQILCSPSVRQGTPSAVDNWLGLLHYGKADILNIYACFPSRLKSQEKEEEKKKYSTANRTALPSRNGKSEDAASSTEIFVPKDAPEREFRQYSR